MRFKVNREEFLSILGVVSRAAATKSPNLVLEGVKFTIAENRILMEATDLDQVCTGLHYPIELEGEGDFVLLTDRILPALREMRDAEVVFNTDEVNLTLTGAMGVFKFRRLSTDDFPTLPKFPESGYHELDGAPFLALLDRTVYCAAREKGRYSINGVHIAFEDGAIELAATDGRRLGFCRMSAPDIKAAKSGIILPIRLAEHVQKEVARSASNDKVLFYSDTNIALFKIKDVVIAGRLVEGEYPNYHGVVPQNLTKLALINIEEFSHLNKMALIFTDAMSKTVAYHFSEGRLVCRTTQSEVGESEIAMGIEYSGEEVRMGFNPAFLNEYLKVVKGETVRFKFESNKKAIHMEVADDEFAYAYVLMPMVVKADMNE